MKIKSNKGIGLVELLVVIAVSALTAPILFQILTSCIQSYSSYNKYIEQHSKVMEVTQRIRKDIEEAAAYKVVYNTTAETSVLTLWIPDDDGNVDTFSVRTWKISNGCLYFKSLSNETVADSITVTTDEAGYSDEILGGLDTATISASPNYMPTRFEYIGINERILLSIKPMAENTVVSKNRNVTKPVVTEFSVRYKEKID